MGFGDQKPNLACGGAFGAEEDDTVSGGGRPRLAAGRARTRRVTFAVTPAELASLDRATVPYRVGPAVRQVALEWAAGGRPVPVNRAAEAAAERRAAARAIGSEVAAVGRLLNSAVRRLHAAGATDGLEERVREAAAAVAAAERRFADASVGDE